MTLPCVLLFLVVSTWMSVSIAVVEQSDVILLRWRTEPRRSECHVLTDAAVQWDGIDVDTEKTIQFSDDNYLSSTSKCTIRGIFCREPSMDGWKSSTNWEINVPLPPITDVRWERLQPWITHSCRGFQFNATSSFFSFSVKGDSIIDIVFKSNKPADDFYRITLGHSIWSEVTSVGRYPARIRESICDTFTTTGNDTNARMWRHFWISLQNNRITLGHLNSTDDVRTFSFLAGHPKPLDNEYVSIYSRSTAGMLWKLHNSKLMYIEKRSAGHRYIRGHIERRQTKEPLFGCVSFWYYMTPNVGLSLKFYFSLKTHYVSSSTLPEWKHFVVYVPQSHPSDSAEYYVSIEGIFPESAPDDSIIAISDFRRCGPNGDTSRTSILPGNNNLFCSLAFPPPAAPVIPCRKECRNGGSCNDGECVCALGFTGKHCDKVIPVCTSDSNCKGNKICSITTKQCVCSTGFTGTWCKKKCPSGSYGPNCTGQCGHCHGSESCDERTGECRSGCRQGYYSTPLCLFPPPYLKEMPRLAHATATSLNISIRFGEDNYDGDGDPAFYSVHHQKVGESEWKYGHLNEISHSNLIDFTDFHVIENLDMGTNYTVRVVLLQNGTLPYNTDDAPTNTFTTSISDNPTSTVTSSSTTTTSTITTEATTSVHIDNTSRSPTATGLSWKQLQNKTTVEITIPKDSFEQMDDSVFYVVVKTPDALGQSEMGKKKEYEELEKVFKSDNFYIDRQLYPDDFKNSASFLIDLNRGYGMYSIAIVQFTQDFDLQKVVETSPIKVENTADSGQSPYVMAGIVGIIVLSALAIIAFLLIRRHKNRNSKPISDRLPLHSITKSGSGSPINVDKSTTLQSATYVPTASRPVSIIDLEAYVKEATASGELLRQFKMLPLGNIRPCKYAKRSDNKSKNRYGNQVPYDDSRVHLQKLPNLPFSDYVNASYVDGYKSARNYIASQGPMQNTLDDFWRMIWQEKVNLVIMLTNMTENGKAKCDKYWPDIQQDSQYGLIKVTCIEVTPLADYTFRKLVVTRGSEDRQVTHAHFTSWPDHGVPWYPQSMATFNKKILRLPPGPGPILVHCSAGVGRTGTIILIDAMLKMAAAESRVDCLAQFQRARERRPNMITTYEQYEFAHTVLIDVLHGDNLSIPCEEFQSKKTEINFLKEFKSLLNQTSGFEKIGRPISGSGTHPWNGVHVDGYRIKNLFITGEIPKQVHRSHFWQTVHDNDVNIIVTILSSPEIQVDFWNDISGGVFRLEEGSIEEFSAISVRELTLHHNHAPERPRVIKQIVHKGSLTSVSLLELFLFVEKLHLQKMGTIVVLCQDGVAECGAFVAGSFVMEKMKLEQEVDAHLAVKIVRQSHSDFIKSPDQLALLYDAAQFFLETFETYSNFH